MLSLGMNTDSHAADSNSHTAMQLAAPKDLLSGQPEDHLTQTWQNFPALQSAVNEVYKKLQENEHSGNQFVVVLGLSKYAILKLLEDKSTFGDIGFRFTFEHAVGVIKVIPSAAHDLGTDTFTRMLDSQLSRMGLSISANYRWGATTTTTHSSTVTPSGKQPDQCFFPAPRAPTAIAFKSHDRWEHPTVSPLCNNNLRITGYDLLSSNNRNFKFYWHGRSHQRTSSCPI